MALARSIGAVMYAVSALGARALAVRETDRADPSKPRRLDRVRAALRTRHYSRRTEEARVLPATVEFDLVRPSPQSATSIRATSLAFARRGP